MFPITPESNTWIAQVSANKVLEALEERETFLKQVFETLLNYETNLYISPVGFTRCCSAFSSHCQKHWGRPLFLTMSVTGFFYLPYTKHVTYSFTSHAKDEA